MLRGPRRAGERVRAVPERGGGGPARPRNGGAVRWGRNCGLELGTFGLGGTGTSDLLGTLVRSMVGIERSAGVLAMRGGSGLEKQWSLRKPEGSQGSSSRFILRFTLSSFLPLPYSQEARHPSTLPVLRHGGGRAVR